MRLFVLRAGFDLSSVVQEVYARFGMETPRGRWLLLRDVMVGSDEAGPRPPLQHHSQPDRGEVE